MHRDCCILLYFRYKEWGCCKEQWGFARNISNNYWLFILESLYYPVYRQLLKPKDQPMSQSTCFLGTLTIFCKLVFQDKRGCTCSNHGDGGCPSKVTPQKMVQVCPLDGLSSDPSRIQSDLRGHLGVLGSNPSPICEVLVNFLLLKLRRPCTSWTGLATWCLPLSSTGPL